MRAWKKTRDKRERIFLYFQAHPKNFFSSDHIAAQVGVGRKRTRSIVLDLEASGKVEGVDLVEAEKWGRTRRIWRSLGCGIYPLRQVEIFETGNQGRTAWGI